MNALPSRHEPSMNLMLDQIDVSETHRAIDPETVKRLSKSINDLGLHHPITVVRGNDRRFVLVAGRHRLEAFRYLGEDRVPAQVVKLSDRDARMWEISENLHRAELTVAQRADQISEYARLAKEKREAAGFAPSWRETGRSPGGRQSRRRSRSWHHRAGSSPRREDRQHRAGGEGGGAEPALRQQSVCASEGRESTNARGSGCRVAQRCRARASFDRCPFTQPRRHQRRRVRPLDQDYDAERSDARHPRLGDRRFDLRDELKGRSVA